MTGDRLDRRAPAPRGRLLGITIPAAGLAFAVLLLATSGELSGPSGWYARIVAVLFGLIALFVLVVAVTGTDVPATQRSSDTAGQAGRDADLRGLARVVIVVAAMVLMLVSIDHVGFWAGLALPVVASLLVLGVRLWWKIAVATVLIVAGGWLIFQVLLDIRFPQGNLWGF